MQKNFYGEKVFVKEKFQYSFSTVLKVLNATKNSFWQKDELNFLSIASSSEEVTKGSLFVPLVANRDGHDFIPSAISNGCSGFLVNRNHPILRKLSPIDKSKAIEVENTWTALADLAKFHRSRFRPFVIGITGSSGKTTTKEMLATSFSHLPSQRLVVTEKNYNNEIGVPFTLFKITDRTEIAIIEMGMNHRGEIRWLTEMAKPDWSIITTIGSAHIENLKSPQRIAQEKLDILYGMPPKGKLFLPDSCGFDPIIQERCKLFKVNPIYWNQKESDLKCIEVNPFGYSLEWKGLEFSWKIPGEKLLSNLSGVMRLASEAGVEDNVLVSNIKKFKSKNRRLVVHKKRIVLIDDTYNANPESMESSISVANQMSEGKPFVCILGDMKELGKHSSFYHKKVGNFIKSTYCNFLIGFGKDALYFNPWKLSSRNQNQFFHFENFEENIQKIIEMIQIKIPSNTVVLVKGSRSMKMERIVEKILEL
jgi:UDP-N-acetylmuramoyl-tripeptide--D-alanyl-D-alanine ligase